MDRSKLKIGYPYIQKGLNLILHQITMVFWFLKNKVKRYSLNKTIRFRCKLMTSKKINFDRNVHFEDFFATNVSR